MSNQSGRGKQSFRVYTKAVNTLKREFSSAIKDGATYSQQDISREFQTLLVEYSGYLKEQELDVDFWMDRAIDLSLQKEQVLIQNFSIPSLPDVQQEHEVNEGEDLPEDNPDEIEDDSTLFGHDILTKENRAFVRNRGKPRKRILVTRNDLEEYVSEVPYIVAIQILRRSDNSVLGYRVWVSKVKDKKRKKSS